MMDLHHNAGVNVMTNNSICLNTYFTYPNQTCLAQKPDFSNGDSPRCDSSPSKTLEKISQIGAKAGVSSARVIISSGATKLVYKDILDTSATKKLGVGQFVSSLVRQLVNTVTDDPTTRTIAHTTTQALRNVYRGTSFLEGAIDGAGYCITNEVAERFKDNGKETKSSILTTIAGAYATEMTESFVSCKLATTVSGLSTVRNTGTTSFICAASLGKGAVSATFVSAFMIYDYFNQDPAPSPPYDNL